MRSGGEVANAHRRGYGAAAWAIPLATGVADDRDRGA